MLQTFEALREAVEVGPLLEAYTFYTLKRNNLHLRSSNLFYLDMILTLKILFLFFSFIIFSLIKQMLNLLTEFIN